MTRKAGRYTKHETAELTRMFGEGCSIYKICRNLNRIQNSIKNNLISGPWYVVYLIILGIKHKDCRLLARRDVF